MIGNVTALYVVGKTRHKVFSNALGCQNSDSLGMCWHFGGSNGDCGRPIDMHKLIINIATDRDIGYPVDKQMLITLVKGLPDGKRSSSMTFG